MWKLTPNISDSYELDIWKNSVKKEYILVITCCITTETYFPYWIRNQLFKTVRKSIIMDIIVQCWLFSDVILKISEKRSILPNLVMILLNRKLRTWRLWFFRLELKWNSSNSYKLNLSKNSVRKKLIFEKWIRKIFRGLQSTIF